MKESDAVRRRKTSLKRILAFLALALGACTMILPFVWMLSTSLKEANLVYVIPPQWIPNPVDWQNYRDIWGAANLITGIRNSFVITLVVLILSTLTSSMAAFSFSKLHFPLKRTIFLMLLSTMMVPAAVLFVPLYIVYAKLSWIDTLLPLIIPVSLCNINNTFFLRQFMIGLPSAYLDAARIDGCSYFGTYWRIFLPLSKPAIVTNAIMLFMATWNDYMNPMIFTNSTSKQTIQVAIAMMSSHYEQQTDIPMVMAASLIALLPVLILFITCQKYFVDSVVITGIKG